MDSDLAWVNGKSGRQSWRYADAFQRSIISEAIYHFIAVPLCTFDYATLRYAMFQLATIVAGDEVSCVCVGDCDNEWHIVLCCSCYVIRWVDRSNTIYQLVTTARHASQLHCIQPGDDVTDNTVLVSMATAAAAPSDPASRQAQPPLIQPTLHRHFWTGVSFIAVVMKETTLWSRRSVVTAASTSPAVFVTFWHNSERSVWHILASLFQCLLFWRWNIKQKITKSQAVARIADRTALQHSGLSTLCSEKNTHSHFLPYLHESCVDLNKNCNEYT